MRNLQRLFWIVGYSLATCEKQLCLHSHNEVEYYWLDEQPELDKWMGILNAQNINPQQHIPSVNWNHPPATAITELERINEVNVGNGGTHSM